MPVYKDEKRGTWYVKFQYQHKNQISYKMKRGFALKREAEVWETNEKRFLSGDSGMSFESLAGIYKTEHLSRTRLSTAQVKSSMIDKMILPFFKGMPVNEITELDVMNWQNSLLRPDANGVTYSQSYLYTINTLLGSIFNYAMKYYNLQKNPVKKAGSIGSLKRNGDAYWTLKEYRRFISCFESGSMLHLAFELLFWTGIREGELLALSASDFIPDDDAIDISKTYHFLNGKEYIAPPKSENGFRRVKLPHSLTDKLKDYILKKPVEGDERLFPISKAVLLRSLVQKTKAAGLSKITVHGLRHSHVSLLMAMGFSPVAIAARVGHKSSYITLRYAHAQKGVQKRMVKAMDMLI